MINKLQIKKRRNPSKFPKILLDENEFCINVSKIQFITSKREKRPLINLDSQKKEKKFINMNMEKIKLIEQNIKENNQNSILKINKENIIVLPSILPEFKQNIKLNHQKRKSYSLLNKYKQNKENNLSLLIDDFSDNKQFNNEIINKLLNSEKIYPIKKIDKLDIIGKYTSFLMSKNVKTKKFYFD